MIILLYKYYAAHIISLILDNIIIMGVSMYTTDIIIINQSIILITEPHVCSKISEIHKIRYKHVTI